MVFSGVFVGFSLGFCRFLIVFSYVFVGFSWCFFGFL